MAKFTNQMHVSSVIFALFLFINSCTRDVKKPVYNHMPNFAYTNSYQARVNDSTNIFVIENPNYHSVKILLDINGAFPVTIGRVINDVKQHTTKKTSLPKAVFQYVTQHLFFTPRPLTTERWQHKPEWMLNSIGGGQCDDLASVMAYICAEMELPVRIVGLSGHVVVEVYHQGKWEMYDPNKKVYYCDSSGRVASLEYLENHPDIVYKGECLCDTSLNALYAFENPYTKRYAMMISSRHNNYDATDWHIPAYEKINHVYNLPPKSSLHFQFGAGPVLENIVLKLAKESSGIAEIPFVPYRVEGHVNVPNVSLRGNDFDTQEEAHRLWIERVMADTKIYYLTNSMIQLKSDVLSIQLASTGKVKVCTKAQKTFTHSFAPGYHFLHRVYEKHQGYLNQINPLKTCNWQAYTMKEYQQFLENDSTFKISEFHRHLTEMNAFLNRIKDKPEFTSVNFNALMQQAYPLLPYYIFLGGRYGKLYLIEEIITEHLNEEHSVSSR